MYNTQLIYTEEIIKYFKDGVEITPKTYHEKLFFTLYGETKVIKTEKIVEEWKVKTKKEANLKFNNWINPVSLSSWHIKGTDSPALS